MSIRIAEGFDAGEVFEHPASDFAVKRFVYSMQVAVSVQEGHGLVVRLQFLPNCCDIFLEGRRKRCRRLTAADEWTEIPALRSWRPIVLKSRIGLRHQDEPATTVGLGFGKSRV